MNQAMTKATTSEFAGGFSTGASMSVTNATAGKGAGNVPASIAQRKNGAFKGSTNQPLRKGVRRKFLDNPENHPRIPKSSYTPATLETVSPISGMSGGPRAEDQNASV